MGKQATEMLKGVLEGIVLALLARRPAHGYEITGWLRDQGFTAADSDANFVLFGMFDDREAVWQGLLDRGVLVRVTGPEGWLRVSVGTPAETAAFKDALVEVAGR